MPWGLANIESTDMTTTSIHASPVEHNIRQVSCAEAVEDSVAREAETPRDGGTRDAEEMLSSELAENVASSRYYAKHAGKPKPWGPISFNRRDQRLAWRRTGGRCFYCGMQTLGPGVGYWSKWSQCYGSMDSRFATWLQVDHFVSRKLGGRSNRDNLFPACPDCNQLKRGHAIEHFRNLFLTKHGSPFFYGEIAS